MAALAWLGAEHTLALGLTPVGVADAGYYRMRMAAPPLPPASADLGPFWEPSLDRLIALKPDLILMDSWSALDRATFERVAPVLPIPAYPRDASGWSFAAGQLSDLGRRLNRESVAQAALAEAERRIEALRARAQAAGAPPVYVALLAQTGRNATLYGGSGLVGGALERLGLPNAWRGPFSPSGSAVVGLDALAGEPDAVVLAIDLATTSGSFARATTGNALWRLLPSVRKRRVAALGRFYPHGGLASLLAFAEQAATAVEAARG
ncbi:ABC cobalamin/Fe3+-siderophore transporter periplasmic ligand-binding protein [Methylopila jiangsuensis]|uniref:ABC cobalamin/Fe3+-siderophore transporter periplasmic ligand-binding protein n=1 Tax=Methylopila jiangsuensis TaxID=586230 RepID=A0A9W6JEF4_9HYPH|nr:ABC transporter substrate-binding protein [Methylopila jiangsuensis]MDR6286303.1 iron complex transport system substrate-binding protein [Methylopila jiangsuensis]GLK76066.1 ABC cobalamin/Fe3+-siderophore transporter periplasmic ligand-binding protein [Methylopila jiangsuensis]